MEGTNIRPGGGRRLVLGFDAGCVACSQLARQIEEEVGDKLEVLPLHHPQVLHWRERVLGEEAAWAPTLIEVKGGKVKAWTGLKMALVLSRCLGPRATWRVMQLVGELKSAPEEGTASTTRLTRGKFIKGLGGAAFSVGLLSATGGLASAALAADRTPKDEVDFEGFSDPLSALEELPDSVVARGEKAGRAWLKERLQLSAQPRDFNPGWCAWYVGVALVEGWLPWFKILRLRKLVQKLGVRQFIFAMKVGYVRGRQLGYTVWGALNFAARRVGRISGLEVAGAILSLFGISQIYCNCIPYTC